MVPAILVSLCVVLRVLPHPANFAPAGATAVFAGRTLRPTVSIPLVLAAAFAGDAVLATTRGYPLFSGVTPFVYAAFLGQALLGHVLRRRRAGAVVAALIGSCVFFVLSNFGVWLAGSMYSHNPRGLAACYLAAVPFFGSTLASDVLWTVILVLAYRLLAMPRRGHGLRGKETAARAVPVPAVSEGVAQVG